MKPAKLVLHIDRLRLHGVSPQQRDLLVASLEAELARSLAQDGVAAGWASRGHREHLRLQLQGSAAQPGALGESAARSIAAGEVQGRGER